MQTVIIPHSFFLKKKTNWDWSTNIYNHNNDTNHLNTILQHHVRLQTTNYITYNYKVVFVIV